MPECRTVRHPVSPVPEWKKLTMPEQVRYQTKPTQSSIFWVRCRTKILDAGMPMPALVCSMPMPSYTSAVPFSRYRTDHRASTVPYSTASCCTSQLIFIFTSTYWNFLFISGSHRRTFLFYLSLILIVSLRLLNNIDQSPPAGVPSCTVHTSPSCFRGVQT
jgi:hypothetical protein